MARISSYPIDSTIQDKDAWIGTESTNRATRNFTAEDMASYVVTSTSGITGGGTNNYMTMWTGLTSIGDAPMKMIQSVGGGLNLLTLGDNTDLDKVTFKATAEFQGGVRDQDSNLGTAGQILSSTGLNVRWVDVSGGGGGTGTTNTLPIFTDGPGGVLGDSIITQAASGGRIGIGTTDPQRELDVFGGIRVRGPLDLFQQNNNSFAGQDAGNWYNIVGNSNSAFGKDSQKNQLNGSNNTSVGYRSMNGATSGNFNTAVGNDAMQFNDVGSFNTAVGALALQDQEAGQGNTAIGYNSLNNKEESNFNTAVGHISLFNISTGFKNIGIGDNVGTLLSTGSRNVLIGSGANVLANNNANSIVIGEGAVGAGSNTVTLGNNNITDTYLKGNVIFSSTITADGATGTVGQILSSTSTGVEWVDPSAAITILTPHFQIATPGGSATYTQSNNIVDFDWSGSSGTYEYILPSATAIPYRKIRFVNNSTITASDKIRITAPGTETIDGGAFYEISKPYNGCAVWSDGVQWIVIQAKA